MIEAAEVLSVDEAQELAEYERLIEMGQRVFVEIGKALAYIRDGRLYRAQFKTFEAYCEERWKIDRRHAYFFISSAEVVETLCTNVHKSIPLPTVEGQARSLISVPAEQRAEIWTEAVIRNGGNPAPARIVSEVIAERAQFVAAPDSEDDRARSLLDSLKPANAQTIDAKAVTVSVLHSSESNEWYTPTRYIEAVRQVLGTIDLDPASCEMANQTIQAERFFSDNDDGLAHEWQGTVFLNPPYGKDGGESNAGKWTRHLIEQYRKGNTAEAILLVNAFTESGWFKPLFDFPICFTDHRIKFYRPGAEANQPAHGSAFVYLGKDIDGFARVFSEFGTVVARLAA